MNRGAQLLNDTYSSKLRHGLRRQLVKRGVKVILDDYIEELPAESSGPVQIRTAHGKSLEPDLVVSLHLIDSLTELICYLALLAASHMGCSIEHCLPPLIVPHS